MADKPVGEVVAVDAVLDALSSPTSSDVYEAVAPYSNDAVIAAAAKRALVGGGGGGGGGLPTGWTQDGSDPAELESNGGSLNLGSGLLISTAPVTGSQYTFNGHTMVVRPATGSPVGTPSGIGSLALSTSGQAWLKTGAGNDDWTQLGGVPAAALQIVRVPLAFDTAGLAAASGASTGVVAYTPSAGEAIMWPLSYFSVPDTAFDHTTGDATLHLTFSDLDGSFFSNSVDGGTDTADGDTTAPLLDAAGSWIYTVSPRLLPAGTPLRVVFDDGASGDPGMTQGEGELVLAIIGA